MDKKLEKFFKDFVKKVDPVIDEMLISNVDKKYQKLVKYQVSSGGKRLRPALAVMSCNILGGKTRDVLYPSASLEILHNYTLIIDDIIDNSDIRRGVPTTWKKYGVSIADLVGSFFAASVFNFKSSSKNYSKVSLVLSRSIKTITSGQIMDVLFEQGGRESEDFVVRNRYRDISEADYKKMISKKTASLLGACCEVGGICANASNAKVKKIKEFGFNMGMSFQVQDDILDIVGDEKKFGKVIGKDIIEGKMGNIVILFCMDELDNDSASELMQILKKPRKTKPDIKKAMKYIEKTNAVNRAEKIKNNYIKKAEKNIDFFPNNKWKSLLLDTLSFVGKRKF